MHVIMLLFQDISTVFFIIQGKLHICITMANILIERCSLKFHPWLIRVYGVKIFFCVSSRHSDYRSKTGG